MATLITGVGSLVTGAVSWVGSYVGAIMQSGNELLLMFALIPVVGFGIGALRRLISIN